MELPLHPKLVHLPIALAVLMPILGTVLWFALMRSWLPLRSWALAAGAQLLLLASGFFAMQSGETEEERVERVVPEAAIERHEEAAGPFVWASGAVFLLALVPLLLHRRKTLATYAAGATVVGTLGVLALGWQVGRTGGELVYVHGAAAAYAAGPAAGSQAPATRDDDDR